MTHAQTFTIDASGRTPGRVATEAAKLLMGKNEPSYVPNKPSTNRVVITNASKLKISEKKMTETDYERYSGYPGGFRYQTMAELVSKKGYSEVLKQAVSGMLPGNKLHAILIKHLTITE
ncbi:MAG: 50S ribosomal protein L13 [Candidatus Pacebacteria bacterium]|jgi:large subunit ribosomal protein L13|nr:50S ribosomal protein L13 [Candidatus Paceibacterota bacterium]